MGTSDLYSTKDSFARTAIQMNEILSVLPFGIFVVDRKENVVFANEAAQILFEKQLPADGKFRCGDFISCTNADESSKGCGYSSHCPACPLLQAIRTCLTESGDARLDGETPVKKESSGKELWVRFHARRITVEKQPFVILSVEDVTVEKHMRQSRENLQKQLTGAMEMARLGHWQYDVQKDCFTFNDQFYNIFGVTAEQAGGYTLPSATYAQLFVHPDDRHVVAGEIQKAVMADDPNFFSQFDHRMVYADGSTGYIAVRYNIVKDAGGKTIRTYGVNQDITQHKKAEEALRESEEKYRLIFEHSPVGLFYYDDQGVILDCNSNFVRIIGSSKDALVGLNMRGLPDKKIVAALCKALDGQIAQHEGIYHSTTANKTTPVRVLFAPLMDRHGRVYGGAGIVVDITQQMEAARALRESEERYRMLSDVTMEGILIHKNGIVKDVNASLERLLGYERDELIGKNIVELAVHYQDRDRVKQNILKAHARPYTVRALKKNGEVFFAELEARYFQMKDERLRVAAVRDVGERLKAKKALRTSERKWRNILVNTPQIGVGLDTQGRIVFANKYFLELTQWTEQEVHNRDWFEMFIPEEIREEVKAVFRAVMAGESFLDLLTYENEIVTRSGERRNLAWSNVPTRDDRGNIVDVTCLGVDLTERKRAERALMNSHQRFLTVLNSIDATIYAADMETHEIVFMNKSMIDAYGRDMTGEVCWQVLQASPGPCAHCSADRLLDENGRPDDVHVWEERNPVTGRSVINHDRAVEWIDGRMVRLRISTDVTELKTMQERLRQAQKMESIGTLAGGIAHDFNNILFPIIGMAEMLLEDLPPGSPEYLNAQEIYKAGKRGGDLVRQILAFSRRSEYKRVPLQVQTILKEVLKLIRSTIPADIEISQQIDPACGWIMADPTQVHQIAMNLITNAYHAVAESGGKIGVHLQEIAVAPGDIKETALSPGRYARLQICDTGCGIDAALMDKIFDPYFTTKETGKGTGLGLAVVYGIVKESKGDISVRSKPGDGTTFDVYLPLLDVSGGVAAGAGQPLTPSGTERILLVDDEAAIAKLLKQMLERLGYQATACDSSQEALNVFKEDPSAFDLVVSDMTMPGMTGDRLARELIAARPDIPIIICTGYSEKMNQEKAEAMGIKGFLMKPVVRLEMAKMVRQVLDDAAQGADSGTRQ